MLKPGVDRVKAVAQILRGEQPTPEYYQDKITAWRGLFLLNELNELQSERYISMRFTLLFMLFFLQ